VKFDLRTSLFSGVTAISPVPDVGYPVDIKTDAYGRLFGSNRNGTLIAVDMADGTLLGEDKTGLMSGGNWAVLTFNEEIYLFNESVGNVSRYDLATKTIAQVGTLGFPVVGVAAAPCIASP
jgi:hypothetical protein